MGAYRLLEDIPMKLSIAGYCSPAYNWENEPEEDYPSAEPMARTHIDAVEELQVVEVEERDEDAPKPRSRKNRARKANYAN
jgi:hypothetical protein